MKRFQLFLFDDHFEPIEEEWKLLGVTEEQAQVIGSEVKILFEDIKRHESDNFQVRNQSPTHPELTLPGLTDEEAAFRIEQIKSAFPRAVGGNAAEVLVATYLRNKARTTASLMGRDRVVSLRPIAGLDEDGSARTDRYEIKTYILFEGNKAGELQ